MDEIRAELERRQASLHGLRRPSPVLTWLLRHGVDMDTPVDPWTPGEQRLLTLLSRSLRFRRAQCYANAQQAVLLASRVGVASAGHTLEYWEGFANLPMPAPFTHGWCVLNGRAWDPSLDHLGIVVRYLGISIPPSFLREAVARRRTYAPLLPQWHERLNGFGPAAVERTGRVGPSVPQGSGLAGAPPRM